MQKSNCAAPKDRIAFPNTNHPFRPVQQRRLDTLLRFYVDSHITVDWIANYWRVEPCAVRSREARVSVNVPLHWRPHAVTVAEIDVVAHADFVPVIDDRRAGQREQQCMH